VFETCRVWSDEAHFEDSDPLLDDPRHDLRLYAWKLIQSHFVGKYNQIVLVRFCHDGSRAVDTASNLTPFRQSFLVPHHLPEIRSWLRPAAATRAVPPKTAASKSVRCRSYES
jgi:hypothetical protein